MRLAIAMSGICFCQILIVDLVLIRFDHSHIRFLINIILPQWHTNRIQTEFPALKHESRILGQSSNTVAVVIEENGLSVQY